MGTGKIKNNSIFYDGYEGEPQIFLMIKDCIELNISIWDGYFEDIFGTPSLDGNGWHGFTKDYNQMEGAFADGVESAEIDPKIYLTDLCVYTGKQFDYEETAQVVSLIKCFLEYAVENQRTVIVSLR